MVSSARASEPTDTALSPDGKFLAVAFHPRRSADDGAVFDMRTGEEAFRLSAPENSEPFFRVVSWSPDRRYVAAGSDGATRVWDTSTKPARSTMLTQAGSILSVAWSPDSSRLITGGSDGTARVWEIWEMEPRELMSLPAQETNSLIMEWPPRPMARARWPATPIPLW